MQDLRMMAPIFIASSFLAFGLNVCSFAYIKTTSALTMSVSGVVKDVLMIGLSCVLFGSAISWHQCAGFSVAVFGTIAYIVIRSNKSRM